MMIDFEDRSPPQPLGLWDWLIGAMAVAMTAQGLWSLGAQGLALVRWVAEAVR